MIADYQRKGIFMKIRTILLSKFSEVSDATDEQKKKTKETIDSVLSEYNAYVKNGYDDILLGLSENMGLVSFLVLRKRQVEFLFVSSEYRGNKIGHMMMFGAHKRLEINYPPTLVAFRNDGDIDGYKAAEFLNSFPNNIFIKTGEKEKDGIKYSLYNNYALE